MIGKDIIQKVRNSDKKALEMLFRDKYLKLFAYAHKLCHNKTMARNIVRQVFIKIWDERLELPEAIDWDTFLYQKTHTLCRQAFNADKQKKHPNFLPNKILAEQIYHQQTSQESELENRVFNAIYRLPLKEKTVFLMNRFEETPLEKIALKIGLGKKEVEELMAQAVKKLHNELEGDIPVILTISMLSFIIS